jgi:hypothetical protein
VVFQVTINLVSFEKDTSSYAIMREARLTQSYCSAKTNPEVFSERLIASQITT